MQIAAETRENQSAIASARAELRQIGAESIAAEANLRSIEASLKTTQEKLERYRPLAREGGIPQDQLAEVQLAAIQQKQDRLGAIQELKMRFCCR